MAWAAGNKNDPRRKGPDPGPNAVLLPSCRETREAHPTPGAPRVPAARGAFTKIVDRSLFPKGPKGRRFVHAEPDASTGVSK